MQSDDIIMDVNTAHTYNTKTKQVDSSLSKNQVLIS